MPDGFGARLRKHREARQIDLGWIAEQTKIKRSLLEALEREDLSQWPSGIFRRAYIRSYAQIIGLDPGVVLREFLEVYPEPEDIFEAAAAAALEDTSRRHAPAVRLRTIVDSAIGSLARLRRPAAAPSGPEHAPQPSADSARDNGPAATLGDVEASLESAAADPDPRAFDDLREQGMAASADGAAGVESASDHTRPSIDASLEVVATLCTELGRACDRDEMLMLLGDAARAIDATGLIVWLWDESSEGLRPVLVHGYSDQVVAHLPVVSRDADNATAEAFRSAHTCEVRASPQGTGALVAPLLIPDACTGVLAVELQPGIQPAASRRALVTLLAAALAQLVHRWRRAP